MAATSGERALVLVSSYSTATGTTHTAGGIKTHSDKTHSQTLTHAKKKNAISGVLIRHHHQQRTVDNSLVNAQNKNKKNKVKTLSGGTRLIKKCDYFSFSH